MKFYVIANEDCLDCFYDFQLSTYGDGICKNNLLPTKEIAEYLRMQSDLPDGEIVEVTMTFDDEGILLKKKQISIIVSDLIW